jgi:Rrf2 family protein
MKLSSRGEYAARAVLELSLKHKEGPLHIRDISAAQNIPRRFLEQILLELKRHGYLQSRKGPGGGYSLAKDPARISVAEVIRTMDGPLAPSKCVSRTAYEACPLEEGCGLIWLWRRVRDDIVEVLENTTFADLAKRTREGEIDADS